MRIWDFEVGVEMWKVTLSKSETTWSMEAGVVLWWGRVHVSCCLGLGCLQWGSVWWWLWGLGGLRGEAVFEEGFDQDVLVVEEEHLESS